MNQVSVRKRLLLPIVIVSSMLALGIFLLLTDRPNVANLLWAGGAISAIAMAALLLYHDIGAIARKSHIGRNGIWFGATGVALTTIWIIVSTTTDSSTLKWMLYAGVSLCLVSLAVSWVSVKPQRNSH